MNIKKRNKQLYTARAVVETSEHCECENCLFYAAHIESNTTLVTFLEGIGIDPRKADEVWCYMEEDRQKHYTVDFFEIYAEQEETHIFEHAKVVIVANPYAENGRLPYALSIDVVLKM
ncbi:hypothetical protein [Lysinibacillus sp. LZ02]|uniref:hypothetical protein n=1 Tax=Lysinibacillus sp. LZ02 TaxID=3420668 RepID=UPI003D35F27F